MTIMWLIILFISIICSLAGLIYLCTRFAKFSIVKRLYGNNKYLRKIIPISIMAVIIFATYFSLGYVNMTFIIIVLTVFWIISDVIFLIFKKLKLSFALKDTYYCGYAAIIATLIYLGTGWHLCHTVYTTEYTVETDKNVEALKLLLFADAHMTSTFDGEKFSEYVDQMNELNPDVVIIAGDFIDGSSKYEDVVTASKALSKLNTKYGVFFSAGNHDLNFYDEASKRRFDSQIMIDLLNESGVTVLSDEIYDLGNGYVIVGRADAADENRESISSLVSSISADKYIIDINHQPNDYANEEDAGLDMVLSGHTHGGQFFPLNNAGMWMGAVDKEYGLEKRSKTNFIVTSGISDWGLDFKTGCKSEIVVINIDPQIQ